MAPLAGAFGGATVLAPRRPLRQGAGYGWFENRGIGRAVPESVTEGIAAVDAWCREQVAPGCRIWLCGFSNGAAMAGALLLDRPARYAGAALLNGPLVLGPPWGPPWPEGRLAGKPVFLAAGLFDPVIPPDMMNATREYLATGSGAVFSGHSYGVAHEIAIGAVDDLRVWFAAARGLIAS